MKSDFKYLMAFTIPISAAVGIYLGGVFTFLTPFYSFVLIPILEIILRQDASNYSPKEIESRSKSKFFDSLLYLNVPIVFGILFAALQMITSEAYSTTEFIGLVFTVGIVLGSNGINVAHELGHRQGKIARFFAKLLLLPSHYMHFYIEHNFGHHVNAATHEDPATARYNQNIYNFWIQSIVHQYISAWKIQLKLLRREDKSFFAIQNDMLWYLCAQMIYLVTIFLLFQGIGLLFAVLSGVVGFLLLETTNYIEHYGLIRLKKDSGRYERVKEIHSWNSNHVLGRMMLYELTRHSDHHYRSSKKYQILEYHDISPQMPYGYPTSMVLALIPPLWFKIMNPRIPSEMKPSIAA
ncbi:alkane 1-monooxygenase [Galbibacter mesophilus]|uniref:alkane 1-monooxygenase n=1 Tax=Galbibacter mesophilus TaxID=379069 RepID=UPI00191F5F02|nr:alkane 1-monooxygenase [Galbibacter mesophilus]MCM5662277.1 alkane 1-monooxygenase [Galbibacter mesophilus]